MADSVDPFRGSQIWFCNVCPDLPAPIFRSFMVVTECCPFADYVSSCVVYMA